MASHLDDARAVENDDQVCHPHGAETVGDQDCDPAVPVGWVAVGFTAACGGGVTFEQGVLGLGVERGGGLVEDEEQAGGRA